MYCVNINYYKMPHLIEKTRFQRFISDMVFICNIINFCVAFAYVYVDKISPQTLMISYTGQTAVYIVEFFENRRYNFGT